MIITLKEIECDHNNINSNSNSNDVPITVTLVGILSDARLEKRKLTAPTKDNYNCDAFVLHLFIIPI